MSRESYWRFGVIERVLLGVILLFVSAIAVAGMAMAWENAGSVDPTAATAFEYMANFVLVLVVVFIIGGPTYRAVRDRFVSRWRA